MQRTQFIGTFFEWLKGSIEYIWLKALPDTPEQTALHSDIDLFVRKNELVKVIEYIKREETVFRHYMTEKNEATFIYILFQDGSHLKIDLLTRLFRKQWTYLTEGYLFDNRIFRSGIATYTPIVLLEHVLLFNFLNKNGLPEKYIVYFSSMPKNKQYVLVDLINKKYGTDFVSLKEMGRYQDITRNKFISFLKKMDVNKNAEKFKGYWRCLMSIMVKGKIKKAKIITFSGVDGAGKTTILNDLKNVLVSQLDKKVVVLRHRPSILPILSAWVKGRKNAEKIAAENLPRQGKNNNKANSLFRYAYYFTDYLFGQAYLWVRYTLTGHTIIYDRYYFDFIADPKRSNITIGEKIPKWLYRFIVKPDLNIFLYACPSVILCRKKELSACDIKDMTERYKSLFNELKNSHKGEYLCLENIDRKKSLQTILKYV